MDTLQLLIDFFTGYGYFAVFSVLLVCGFGVPIPEDITLTAFDDLPSTLVIDPFLTVAAQPAYHMGQQAAQLLLARLSGQMTAPPQEIVLPTELIVRRSSGPPRQ